MIELVNYTNDKEILLNTPRRYSEAMNAFLTDKPIKWNSFPAPQDSPEVSFNIPFVSLCEHHLLPFFGEVKITYLPDKVVGGASKFYRLVKHFSNKLQIQERLNKQIFDYLYDKLEPKRLTVSIESRHMCIEMRGAEEKNSIMKTIMQRTKQ